MRWPPTNPVLCWDHYSHKLWQLNNLIVSANKLIFRSCYPNHHESDVTIHQTDTQPVTTIHRSNGSMFANSTQGRNVCCIKWGMGPICVGLIQGVLHNTMASSRPQLTVDSWPGHSCLSKQTYQLSNTSLPSRPLTVNKTFNRTEDKKPHVAHGRHNNRM